LASERGSFMAPFEDSLDRCFRDMRWDVPKNVVRA